MNRQTIATLILVGVLLSLPVHAQSLRYDYDPGLYVLWNHAVVVGEFFEDAPVEEAPAAETAE